MASLTTLVGSGYNYLHDAAKRVLDANFSAINTELTSTTSGSLTGILNTSSTATLSGAGAIPITAAIAEWTTTAADAGTLADGAEGQHLFIVMVADGGDGTLTPTNLAGGTTITFDAVGDSVHLLFTAAAWYVVGISGAVVA